MNNSILESTKKYLGAEPEYEYFDSDIVVFVNTVLATLHQLGIGDSDFFITSSNETWDDLVYEPIIQKLAMSYVFIKTKLFFDPPSSSSITEIMNKELNELEWRMQHEVDHKED